MHVLFRVVFLDTVQDLTPANIHEHARHVKAAQCILALLRKIYLNESGTSRVTHQTQTHNINQRLAAHG